MQAVKLTRRKANRALRTTQGRSRRPPVKGNMQAVKLTRRKANRALRTTPERPISKASPKTKTTARQASRDRVALQIIPALIAVARLELGARAALRRNSLARWLLNSPRC